MTPWYGAAGMAGTLCTVLGAGCRCDFVSTKQVAKIHQQTEPRGLCPVEFFVVCVALVTRTRSSSEYRPDIKAEATGRLVALSRGRMASWQIHKKRVLLRRMVPGAMSAKICPAVALGRAPVKKKAAWFWH